jgi:hypothetical protein
VWHRGLRRLESAPGRAARGACPGRITDDRIRAEPGHWHEPESGAGRCRPGLRCGSHESQFEAHRVSLTMLNEMRLAHCGTLTWSRAGSAVAAGPPGCGRARPGALEWSPLRPRPPGAVAQVSRAFKCAAQARRWQWARRRYSWARERRALALRRRLRGLPSPADRWIPVTSHVLGTCHPETILYVHRVLYRDQRPIKWP